MGVLSYVRVTVVRLSFVVPYFITHILIGIHYLIFLLDALYFAFTLRIFRPGHLLMFISLTLNFFFCPISLIRVAVNKKISATVAWMQMSAPAVSLYALTIMAQPSFIEEQPDVTKFQRVHREMYLPCMHVMCAFSLIGMAASIHSLWDRWADFKRKEFSPAHVAFCFPTLSHANSIQAYRGAVKVKAKKPNTCIPCLK